MITFKIVEILCLDAPCHVCNYVGHFTNQPIGKGLVYKMLRYVWEQNIISEENFSV